MSGTSPVVGAEAADRPVLASYDTYAAAQKAVDTLSDAKFPVQNLAIVGVGLRTVESVLGRMSWGRAAAGGAATGAWFGLLIGLLISLFATANTSTFNLILLGLLYGAAFGIVAGLISYAMTGGRRDFVSRSSLVAERYDVVCDPSVLAKARQILGLPTPFGGAAAPTPTVEPPAPPTVPPTDPSA